MNLIPRPFAQRCDIIGASSSRGVNDVAGPMMLDECAAAA
jgi:hypothetical protein